MTEFLQTVMHNNYPKAYLVPYQSPMMKPSVKNIFQKTPSFMFTMPKTPVMSPSITWYSN